MTQKMVTVSNVYERNTSDISTGSAGLSHLHFCSRVFWQRELGDCSQLLGHSWVIRNDTTIAAFDKYTIVTTSQSANDSNSIAKSYALLYSFPGTIYLMRMAREVSDLIKIIFAITKLIPKGLGVRSELYLIVLARTIT